VQAQALHAPVRRQARADHVLVALVAAQQAVERGALRGGVAGRVARVARERLRRTLGLGLGLPWPRAPLQRGWAPAAGVCQGEVRASRQGRRRALTGGRGARMRGGLVRQQGRRQVAGRCTVPASDMQVKPSKGLQTILACWTQV